MSRHICFRCACRGAEFCASSRFTTLFWDDLLGVLRSHGIENPFWLLPDDARADGGDLHRWLESTVQTLASAPSLPALYQVWRVHDDGETWGSDAGYFLWRGEPHIVSSVFDALLVHRLEEAQWEQRRPWIPYALPVLDDVRPAIVPAPRDDEDGRPMHTLAADDFERLFRGTPLRLEHGPFLDFLRPELDQAREAARHAAEAREPVVLYTY